MRDFRNLSPDDYLKILWRRKWYIIISFLLVSTGSGIYAFRMPLVYRSQTMIAVDVAPIAEDYVRPIVRMSPAERIDEIRVQVRSRSFLERIVQEFQLFGYGVLNDFNMEKAVDALGRGINVDRVSGGVFSLSFVATDPQLARDITRRIAAALIQANQSARKNKTLETDQFIEAQLRQTERDLAAHEEKIKRFKSTHLGQLPEQSAANLNALNNLQSQLVVAENSILSAQEQRRLLDFRLQEQKRFEILSRGLAASESQGTTEKPGETVSGVASQLEQRRALLAEIKAKYTSRHPDVIRLSQEVLDLEKQAALERNRAASQMADRNTGLTPLGRESSTQPESTGLVGDLVPAMNESAVAELKMEIERADRNLARREKEKDEIIRQVKVVQGKLNLAPALEQEFLSLDREHEVLRQQYASLQSKKFNTQLAASVETDTRNETYRVIDEANLSTRSVFPNRVQIILIGLGAGFLVGLGVAFGREYMDPTLRSEEEVTAALGLPVLIAVPELPKQRAQKRLLGLGASP